MKAMVIKEITNILENPRPLEKMEIPVPEPGDDDILIQVTTCGVCHTELDEIEGRTPPPQLPVIPGHEVVGHVVQVGKNVKIHAVSDRVGVAWIYSSCGKCAFCLNGNENLCRDFRATGRDAHGGYAEYMKVPAVHAHPIPAAFTDEEAAPLLCAGAIGYRALKLTGIADGDSLGMTGFGGSAHLMLKMVRYRFPDTRIFVFARNPAERKFALELGAVWAGETEASSPEKLNAIVDTTPVWKPVVEALKNLKPGGRLVINAIRKEKADIEYLKNLDYARHLWEEKEIKSVANVTRRDPEEFLQLAADAGIKPKTEIYSLEGANEALYQLKKGEIIGAKVLKIA